jgi:hypothetical protein
VLIVESLDVGHYDLAQETTSWYDQKGELTFADILVSIKRAIWAKRYFSKSETQPDFDKYTDDKIKSLIYQLSLAA